MRTLARCLPLLAFCGLALACSDDEPDPGGAGSMTGGFTSQAGSSTSQGGSASGSTGGQPGAGGSNNTMGGRTGAGGTNGKAGASGTASGGTASGGTASGDPYGDARIRCVDRTNELRATKGLGPIPRLAKAEPCVDGQAKADSESNKPHGSFNACLDQVKWTGAAQNECPGYGSVEDALTSCLDAMWDEGPGGGHYDNMVGNSTHTACGIYTTPGGDVWLVQDFWTE